MASDAVDPHVAARETDARPRAQENTSHQVARHGGGSREALREQIADLQHQQWTGWMRYLFSKAQTLDNGDYLCIPKLWWTRWLRQMDTPYAQLSEKERDSDREEADRVLALLTAALGDGGGMISANPDIKEHASAPVGQRCADCQMDWEACPRCYQVWWQRRHPNVMQVGDGGGSRPMPEQNVMVDAESRLIADFILALDSEKQHLMLEPAMNAITRYKERILSEAAQVGAVARAPQELLERTQAQLRGWEDFFSGQPRDLPYRGSDGALCKESDLNFHWAFGYDSAQGSVLWKLMVARADKGAEALQQLAAGDADREAALRGLVEKVAQWQRTSESAAEDAKRAKDKQEYVARTAEANTMRVFVSELAALLRPAVPTEKETAK